MSGPHNDDKTLASRRLQQLLLEQLKILSGATSDLTYSVVAIEEAAAGYKDLGVGTSGQYVRLHALVVTMRGAGTLQFHSDTDGAGAGESDLSGPIALGANAGLNIPFKPSSAGKLTSVVDEHLSIESTVAGFDGYAIISKG